MPSYCYRYPCPGRKRTSASPDLRDKAQSETGGYAYSSNDVARRDRIGSNPVSGIYGTTKSPPFQIVARVFTIRVLTRRIGMQIHVALTIHVVESSDVPCPHIFQRKEKMAPTIRRGKG